MAIPRSSLLASLLLALTWTCIDGRVLNGRGSGHIKSSAKEAHLGFAGAGETYPPTSCKHDLAGVDDTAVMDALRHKVVKHKHIAAVSAPLRAVQHQKIFVAACLHNSEAIMPHWTSELMRLLLALKDSHGKHTKIFVSVYESGSKDGTTKYLELLEGHLAFINVSSRIVHNGGVTRKHKQRIEFLAEVRNRAMDPLRESKEVYDRVLWLSDSLFCADGVLQMLAHALPEKKGGLGADAVCGMDYLIWGGLGPDSCKFYDIWAAHDETGQNFRSEAPIVRFGEKELEAGLAFQTFSCWNAMVVFDADIFQKEKLFFRTNRDDLGECAAAETEFIFRDMWVAGRGKIAVSPLAASAYTEENFQDCALPKQPTEFDSSSAISWKPAPKTVECCPLKKNKNDVDFGGCFNETWNRFGGKVPRVNSSFAVHPSHAKEHHSKKHGKKSFLQLDDSFHHQ